MLVLSTGIPHKKALLQHLHIEPCEPTCTDRLIRGIVYLGSCRILSMNLASIKRARASRPGGLLLIDRHERRTIANLAEARGWVLKEGTFRDIQVMQL